MKHLSAELADAEVAMRTYALLHKTEDDSDLPVWQALVVVRKAIAALRAFESDC